MKERPNEFRVRPTREDLRARRQRMARRTGVPSRDDVHQYYQKTCHLPPRRCELASGDGALTTTPPAAGGPIFHYDPASPVRPWAASVAAVSRLDRSIRAPNESRGDVSCTRLRPPSGSRSDRLRDARVYAATSLPTPTSRRCSWTSTSMDAATRRRHHPRQVPDSTAAANRSSRTGSTSNHDLWGRATCSAGHRIRVYVSSSNFPPLQPEPDTGEKTSGGTAIFRAKQTIS